MNLVRYYAFPAENLSSLEVKRYPVCAVTLASAGPMKAGIDDENRARVFHQLGIAPESVVSVQQIHSRIVHIAAAPSFSDSPEGDGILAVNTNVVPCISVADCMPIFVFDPVSGCFGVLHSGWKGTGIIQTALELATEEWGAKSENFKVILGPHIRSCCYTIDAERADYFTRVFGPSCVTVDPERAALGDQWPYRLSLAEANRLLCLSLGIPAENILDTNECTSCDTVFGSHRREGPGHFTHMAAFISSH